MITVSKNLLLCIMTLLSTTKKIIPIDGLSTIGKRHISVSLLNTLQFNSLTLHGVEAKENPYKPHTKVRYIGTPCYPSRLFNSISNNDAHVKTKHHVSETTHPYIADMKPALSAIRKACKITTSLQPTTVDKNISGVNKKDASPVTIGDFAVQALVLKLLDREFNHRNKRDIFIAEEASKNLMSQNEKGDTVDLSNEILEIMKNCGFDGIIGDIDDLNRSIDLGQTYEENGSIRKSVLQENDINNNRSFRTWCLDPIDGTRGFLRGKREGGQYCVALALIEDGNPVVGILGCPNLPASSTDTNYAWSDDETSTNNLESRGCIIIASKGGGCYQLPLYPPDGEDDESMSGSKRIHVTQNDGKGEVPLCKARFCIGVEKYSDPDGKISSIAEAIHGELSPDGDILYAARMDSQVKYGVVARGGAEFYARLPKKSYVEWIWDHAPGRIVIEEAGGVQTDTNGNVINYGSGAKMDMNVDGIIASPGGIFHSELMKNL